jgi:hypothetical protein
MVLIGLRHLATTDPTILAAEAQAKCLRALEQGDAISTAARASAVLGEHVRLLRRPQRRHPGRRERLPQGDLRGPAAGPSGPTPSSSTSTRSTRAATSPPGSSRRCSAARSARRSGHCASQTPTGGARRRSAAIIGCPRVPVEYRSVADRECPLIIVASASSVARLRCELLTAGQLEPPADGRITMTVPFTAVAERFVTGVPSRRNVQVVPPAEQWISWNWPGVLPIKTGEAGAGEAVAPDWADGAVAFSACRVPAAYPAARPPRSPVTPRMMATAGGRRRRTVSRQRVGGRSRPCSRMSGPSAASPLDGG